jgi:hypothetical protein
MISRKIFFIIILCFILINNNVPAQSRDENPFSIVDAEYSQLYNELLEIVKNEFVMPINNSESIFDNDNYSYGLHTNQLTGRIYFYNASNFKCDYGTPVFSMTSGIIKDIIRHFHLGKIVIEYNDIEISYWYLENNNDLKVGDIISAGQLLGTNSVLDTSHGINGIAIRVKYKSFYFDIGYIFNSIRDICE